jgi:CheY-like chemotaxis protein
MPRRLLVVDDESSVASMLKTVLEAAGYTVDIARSAAEAVARLASSRFDVVVTDMKMENEAAGFEVVRAAKLLPNGPAVLILSAFPMLARRWREAGADALLPKPMSLEQLLKTIETLGRASDKPSP